MANHTMTVLAVAGVTLQAAVATVFFSSLGYIALSAVGAFSTPLPSDALHRDHRLAPTKIRQNC